MGGDLGPLLSAATDYGDARYADGRADGRVQGQADRQAEVDAATARADAAERALADHLATHDDTPPGWRLHYDTRFVDLDGWTVSTGTRDNHNGVHLPRNVTTSDRGLTIAATAETGQPRPYGSGEITGRTSMVVPNYFRAEVTGTFEDLPGIWPCLLWFRPQNGSDGEIDLMEWMGGMWSADQKRVAITMHNEYGASQDSIKRPATMRAHPWFDPNAEHDYVLEKVPGSITVWIDGRKISTFTAADKPWWNRIMEVPDRTWYPRVTMQVGEGSRTKVVKNPPPGFTRSELHVRRIRLFTQAG